MGLARDEIRVGLLRQEDGLASLLASPGGAQTDREEHQLADERQSHGFGRARGPQHGDQQSGGRRHYPWRAARIDADHADHGREQQEG